MSSSSNNSWTIVTPEESAAAETLRPLTEGTERQDEPRALTEDVGAQESEEDHLTAEETISKPCEEADLGVCLPSSAPLDVLHDPVPDAPTEDTPVDARPSSTEQESFSDSYSHLSPSTEDSPAPPLTTETLGHLDSEERVQTDVGDETQHQSETQELQEEETEPAQCPLKTQEPSVQTESISAQEAEPEVRRRRSLLEKIGQHDEEEEAEEDFQLPQREEDSGITLNKCILGAVILLGLGTIFMSESEYPSGELKDSEPSGKQEWLNPATEADSTELLNKLHKENEQVATLQSQLQSQKEELKVASAQAAESSAERLRHDEVEKENTATAPPGGRKQDNIQRPADQQVHRKDKHDRGVREEWKDNSEWKKEKKLRKDGGKMEGKDKDKEWKKEGEKFDRKRMDDKYSKHSEDSKEWKKDKSKRGDEGKQWKDKYEKKEWSDKSDKKSKHDKFKEEKDWRSREEWRDFKESKHHGVNQHKGPGDKEKKKGRDVHKEEYQEKYERKHWKEREGHESRNGRDSGERSEHGKDQKKWKKKEDKRQWKKEEEWNGGEKTHQKERREGKSEKHKGSDHGEHTWSERKPAHSHPKPSVGQPEYWSRQRERLQHSSKPLQPCHSPDTCAQAEGVRPVNYAEFEAILQNYLSKAQTAGVDASQIEELKKVAAEMFQNGVFPHDQMSFQDYVEDVGDILEDLVEGDDDDGQNESDVEDEMEGFEREIMQKFALSESGERGRVKGEWREASGKGRA